MSSPLSADLAAAVIREHITGLTATLRSAGYPKGEVHFCDLGYGTGKSWSVTTNWPRENGHSFATLVETQAFVTSLIASHDALRAEYGARSVA